MRLADAILRHMAWNRAYAHELLRDVPDALWSQGGGKGLENHPAWTLGHLVSGASMVAEGVGEPRPLPDGWEALFLRHGPGDPRLPPDTTYPDREALLAEYEACHEAIERGLGRMSDADLAVEEEWRFDTHLGRVGESTLFMTIAHECMHLGQLAAWRRAHDLPSALGRLPR